MLETVILSPELYLKTITEYQCGLRLPSTVGLAPAGYSVERGSRSCKPWQSIVLVVFSGSVLRWFIEGRTGRSGYAERAFARYDSNSPVSPLRQRMIDDMVMRKLSAKTQSSYLRHVSSLGEYLGRSPRTATSEDLRSYQLHLVNSGKSSGHINAQLSGLRFFFEVTLDDANVLKRINCVQTPSQDSADSKC